MLDMTPMPVPPDLDRIVWFDDAFPSVAKARRRRTLPPGAPGTWLAEDADWLDS